MNTAAYQSAFDEANAELKDIVGQFDQLRMRKEKVEKAVEVLKMLVGTDARVEENRTSEEPSAYSFEQVPAPLPELPEGEADPFKRRNNKNGLATSFFGQGRQGFQQAV